MCVCMCVCVGAFVVVSGPEAADLLQLDFHLSEGFVSHVGVAEVNADLLPDPQAETGITQQNPLCVQGTY